MNKYFNGDKLAYEVWNSKYALKDNEGNFLEETPDDMHRRLAKEFFRIEGNYKNNFSENLSEYGKNRKQLTEDVIYSYFKDFKIH